MLDLKEKIREIAEENHLSEKQEKELYINISKIINDYLSTNNKQTIKDDFLHKSCEICRKNNG